jgi:hypothetical protein
MPATKCQFCGATTILPELGETGESFGCMKCGRPVVRPPKVAPAAPAPSGGTPAWVPAVVAFAATVVVGFVVIKLVL